MNNFANKAYHNEIVAAMMAVGFRFLTEVQISTDDLPYHVPVDKARNTTLVFDVPGRAVFVCLDHTENLGFMGGGYQSYVSVRFDFDYGCHERLLNEFVRKNGGVYDENKFKDLEQYLARMEEEGLRAGWASRSDGQCTFNGEFSATYGNEEKNDPHFMAEVIRKACSTRAEYTETKFRELMMLWEPVNTFSGDSRAPSEAHWERQAQCKNLFWERFGDRSIIKEKVAKAI